MKQLLRYTRRYIVLALLALFLVPINLWQIRLMTTGSSIAQPNNVNNQNYTAPTMAFYDVALYSDENGWAIGGSFQVTYSPNGIPLREQPDSGLIWRLQGDSWTKFAETSQPLLSLVLTGKQDGWAVGY